MLCFTTFNVSQISVNLRLTVFPVQLLAAGHRWQTSRGRSGPEHSMHSSHPIPTTTVDKTISPSCTIDIKTQARIRLSPTYVGNAMAWLGTDIRCSVIHYTPALSAGKVYDMLK